MFQLFEELAGAWQVTVDMKLGMFEEHKTPDDPLAVPEGVTLKPNPPFVAPHSFWTKVIT